MSTQSREPISRRRLRFPLARATAITRARTVAPTFPFRRTNEIMRSPLSKWNSMAAINLHLRLYGLLVLLLFLADLTTLAEPLPPPAITKVVSRNNEFEAESIPQTNETTVYKTDRGPAGGYVRGAILWKFPRWFRSFLLSNDGSAIVSQTDYREVLPAEVAKDDYVLLTVIVGGKVIREITVKQLLGSRSNLQPTGLNTFYWGRVYYEMDLKDRVLVDTVIGFFIFDAHTGKCIFPPSNRIDPLGARRRSDISMARAVWSKIW
jgi:hypothetical protein